MHSGSQGPVPARRLSVVASPTETDPVCGMTVTPEAPERASFEGRTYYFCCDGCRTQFEQDPRAFLGAGPGRPGTTAAPADGWTCPMHPEIVRERPGDCPLCGMALEPRGPAAASEETPELADMTRRFWVCALLAAPVVALAMGKVAGPWVPWLQAILAGVVVLWGGQIFFARALASLTNRRWNMFTLIGLGVGVAYGYSLVVLAFPDLLPTLVRDKKGEVGLYFESAAAIVTLVLLGQVLELRARQRTGAAIRALLDLTPKRALRIRPDGGDEEIGTRRAPRRGPAACAPGREDPGRRDRPRGGERRRRIDDHRRADPGGEGAGRPAGRRHAERNGRAHDAGRAGGAGHGAGPDRPDGRRGPAQPGARSSGWPTSSPASSSRQWSARRSLPSPPGRW